MADPACRLLPPKSPHRPTDLAVLIGALVTQFDSCVGIVRAALQEAEIEEWGKVQQIDSEAGDTMWSSSLGVTQNDRHDATFVCVGIHTCS